MSSKVASHVDNEVFMTASQVAQRWNCSVPTVFRIVQRNNFKRLKLSDEKNGCVRYMRSEVLAYEANRLI